MKLAMKNLTTLLVITLVCLLIACGYVIGTYLSPSIDQATSASCPNTMAEIIQSAQGNVYEVIELRRNILNSTCHTIQ
jgi:outer membrane lipopolysaccharide assembly protein LptE/RlpB